MTDLLVRVRAQLDQAKRAGLEVRTIHVEDLEALLVIAEQPALSLTARLEETPPAPGVYPGFRLTFEQAVRIGRAVDAVVNAPIGDPE